MGYTAAFTTYQVGTLITTGSFGNGFIPGLIAVAVIISYIAYLMRDKQEKLEMEYSLNT
jgi:ferrous iron transport protein B